MSSLNVKEVKVTVIGDTDVGKSSLSKRYIDGKMPDNSTPTIGASFLQKRVTVDGVTASLQIWDTAGQERFQSMAPMYYKQAKAAVCVFDLTNEESFHRLGIWLKDFRCHADPNAVVCIAGNKCDITSHTFDLEEARKFAESNDAQFFLTSAMSGEGVDEIFTALSRRLVETYDMKQQLSGDGVNGDDDALRLDLTSKSKKKAKCC